MYHHHGVACYSSLMVAQQPFRSTLDGEHPSGLLVDEWNLLSVAFKNAVDSRRAAWRVITSIEQKEKFKGEEQLVLHAREHVAKVEGELQKIRDGILALMDKKLIPSPGTDESKVFYYKMKGDYHRYLAQFATGEAKSKAGEDACVAYAEVTKITEKDLVVTHPVRLAMALNDLDDTSLSTGVQADPEIELEATTPVAEDRTRVNLNITDATPPVADPSCRKRKGSDITRSPRVRAVMRTHDDDDRCEIFIGDIASIDQMEEDTCAHAVVPARSGAQRELDDTKSEMECVKEELKEMKEMLEFLVRRERKVDVRTEVAVKKLQRLEKERDEENDKEREATLKEALFDKTKVVKLVVGRWFVDKGKRLWQSPNRRDRLHPRKCS